MTRKACQSRSASGPQLAAAAAAWLVIALLVPSTASADIVFLGVGSRAGGYGVPRAVGGGATVSSKAFAHSLGVDLGPDQRAGLSHDSESAVASYVGTTRSFVSVAGAPVTAKTTDRTMGVTGDTTITTTRTTSTTVQTTTMSDISAYESLPAVASNFQDMFARYVSPSIATFPFKGNVFESLRGAVVTSMASTPVTTTTSVMDTRVSAVSPWGTKTTQAISTPSNSEIGPTTVTTTTGVPSLFDSYLYGQVWADGDVRNQADFTFQLTGTIEPALVKDFSAEESPDVPQTYQIEILEQLADQPVLPNLAALDGNGQASRNIQSPGSDWPFISQPTEATADDYGLRNDGLWMDSLSIPAPRFVQLDIRTFGGSPTTQGLVVAEPPTLWMLILGLAGFASAVPMLRRLAAVAAKSHAARSERLTSPAG